MNKKFIAPAISAIMIAAGFFGVAQAAGSKVSVTIATGRVASVALDGSNLAGLWSIKSNSNRAVAQASIQGTSVIINGLKSGKSVVVVCPAGSKDCLSINVTVSNGVVLGSSSYANGALINYKGTIYIVYKNQITPFANYTAFKGLGFAGLPVLPISDISAFTLSAEGPIVSSSGQHPWGSWIVSGKSKYFVSPDGLIPIPSQDILLGNGGSTSLFVPANRADLSLPKLPDMVPADPRLSV